MASRSIGDLAVDVHEVVRVSLSDAQRQVARIVEQFGYSGLLTSSDHTSTDGHVVEGRDMFVSPSTPSAENAARLGTVSLTLRFGDRAVRVRVRLAAGRTPLVGRVGRSPRRDRRGCPTRIHLHRPPGIAAPSSTRGPRRIRAQQCTRARLGVARPCQPSHGISATGTGHRAHPSGVVAGDRTTVCLSPLVYVPPIADADLSRAGLRLIDRLALDIDISSGRVAEARHPLAGARGATARSAARRSGRHAECRRRRVLAGAGSAPISQATAVARSPSTHCTVQQTTCSTPARLTAGAQLSSSSPESLIGHLTGSS